MPDNKKIGRREFLASASAAVASLPFINIHRAFAADKKPNFVFILTDDQRYDAMSCAGHPFLFTPNIDRLAKEGARFRNAFVTIALCSPSRGCFLTGRYAHSHGVINNGTPFSDEIPTMPQALQKVGYDTAFIGKWHMDGQERPRPGFNHWISFKGQGVYYNPTLNINGEAKKVDGYMTDILTEFAVDWLSKTNKNPFCLYLCHKAVHGPFQPAVRHSKLYENVRITKPSSMNDTLEGKPEWVKLGMEPGHDAKGALKSKEGYELFIRDYNRTIMAVDDSVGRILKTLEAINKLDDTVVVFASDNGYFQGEHGRLDKRAMYEESIRIPFLMRYPKLIKPGTLVDGMVLNIDLAPTFLDLAGVPMLPGNQGLSIVPLLKGRKSNWRSDWLYEYFQEKGFPRTPTIIGVRTDCWKYIEYPEINDKSELYNLKDDPQELRNLVDDPKYKHILAEMKSRLERLKKETGYPK
ncbi:MAG: sulfatase [Armatimonadetes bacterium]|nr:sulfatase [Armatimonadota bacterium]